MFQERFLLDVNHLLLLHLIRPITFPVSRPSHRLPPSNEDTGNEHDDRESMKETRTSFAGVANDEGAQMKLHNSGEDCFRPSQLLLPIAPVMNMHITDLAWPWHPRNRPILLPIPGSKSPVPTR